MLRVWRRWPWPWALTGTFPAVFDIVGDLTFADFKIALKQGDNGIVATVPDADLFDTMAWKAANLGPGKVATFVRSAETGVVTATFFGSSDLADGFSMSRQSNMNMRNSAKEFAQYEMACGRLNW